MMLFHGTDQRGWNGILANGGLNSALGTNVWSCSLDETCFWKEEDECLAISNAEVAAVLNQQTGGYLYVLTYEPSEEDEIKEDKSCEWSGAVSIVNPTGKIVTVQRYAYNHWIAVEVVRRLLKNQHFMVERVDLKLVEYLKWGDEEMSYHEEQDFDVIDLEETWIRKS